MFFRSVVNNLNLFERYKGAAGGFLDHLICSLEKRFDLVALVNDFYNDWQIKGEIEKFCCVDAAAGSVRQNSAKHGRTGDPLFLRRVYQSLIKRPVSEFVGLADKDPQ